MANRFWVGADGNWNDTAKWSTTSGGAGGASVPGSADVAIFDGSSNTGTTNWTVTVNVSATVSGLTLTTVDAILTLATAGNLTVTGSSSIQSNTTTTNGLIVNGNASLGAVTLTRGTLNINGSSVTMSTFTSTAANVRTFDFGTNGTVTLTGSGATIWNVGNASTSTISGTGTVVCNYSGSVGTRTIANTPDTGATGVSFSITAGTDTVVFTAADLVNNIDFTGFSGTWTNVALSVYGNLTTSTGMTVSAGTGAVTFAATSGTKTLTTNGKTWDFPVTFDGVGGTWQLVDALTVGSTRTTTLTNGSLNLNGKTLTTGLFSSAVTNTRTLTSGVGGNITITGSGATVYTVTSTNLSVDTNPTVNLTYSGSTGTRTVTTTSATSGTAPILSVSAGADIVTGTFSVSSMNLTGFTGTFTGTVSSYGNVTVGSGVTSYTGSTTFVNTSGTAVLTSNGVTLGNITVNGAGGTVQLAANASSTTTSTTTLTAGTLDLNNKVLTTGLFVGTGSGVRSISFGSSGQIALSGNAGTILDFSGASASNLTATGTVFFNSTYTGATGTRTFNTNGLNETQANSLANVATSGTSGIVLGTSATDIVSLSGNFGNVDLSGFTNTLAVIARTVYGNWTFPASGGTFNNGSPVTTFGATSGTKTITSNGRAFDWPVTFDGVGGTWQLVDAMTVNAIRTTTLTNGTLDLNGKTLSTGVFSTAGTASRSILFGTAQIALTGNARTVLSLSGSNLTRTGTVFFNSTYTGATGTRTFSTTGLSEADANIFCNVYASGTTGIVIGTTATDITAFSGSFGNFDLTGFTTTFNPSATIYGNFTVPSSGGSFSAGGSITFAATSGTKTITSNGRTLDCNITFDGVGGTWQLADNFATGVAAAATNRLTTLTNGTLDLNNKTYSTGSFASSNSNARTIIFGTTGNISLTCLANTATVWNTGTFTNLTFTGTPLVNVNASGAAGTKTISTGSIPESNAINFVVALVGGTGAVSFSAPNSIKNLTLTSGGLDTSALTIYGDLTVASGMVIQSSSSGIFTFAATSGTKTITTNGKTIDRPFTFDGVGGFWQLADALTLGATRTLTVTNGSFNANNKNVSAGLVASNNSNIRSVTMGSGTWTLASTGTVWDFGTTTNLTLSANTSTIFLSDTSVTARTFAGGGLTYNNFSIGGATGTSTLTISGSNTFATVSSTKTVAHTITFTAGTTTTVSGWTVTGTVGNVVTINSTVAGTAANLVKTGGGQVSVDYLSIQDSAASPSVTWYAGANSTNVSGNSGWVFAAPVYYYSDAAEFASALDVVDTILAYGGFANEGASAADTVDTNASLTATVSEASSGVDAASSLATFTATAPDAASGADSASTIGTFNQFASETASGSDAANSAASFPTSASDSASGIDAAASAATFAPTAAETASIVDESLGGSAYNVTAANTASAVDATSTRATLTSTAANTASGLDSVTTKGTFNPTVAEAASGLDSIASAAGFSASAAETAQGQDAVNTAASFSVTATNTAQALDAAAQRLYWDVIDDAQTANWQNVNSSQSVTWTVVGDTQSPNWQNIPTEKQE